VTTAQVRLAFALLVIVAVAAAVAPAVAPYAPDAVDLMNRRAGPSGLHWLGTDDLGRDLLSRIVFGARVSLAVGVVAGALSALFGTAVGLVAGYAGRWTDDVLMRCTDAMLAVPRLPLLMIASVVLSPTVPALVVLVGAVGWMETARVVRAEALTLKSRDWVSGAKALGGSPWRVAARHVLPSATSVIAAATTLAVARGILLESTLSFFGVGVQPPRASWGNMLYQGQATLATEPWLAVFPGLAILVTVYCLNVLGDALVAAPAAGRGWNRRP